MVDAAPPAKQPHWIFFAIPLVAVLALVVGAAIGIAHRAPDRSVYKSEFCHGWTALQSTLSAISTEEIGDKQAAKQLNTEQHELDNAAEFSGEVTSEEMTHLDFLIGQLIGKLQHLQVSGGSRAHLIDRIHTAAPSIAC